MCFNLGKLFKKYTECSKLVCWWCQREDAYFWMVFWIQVRETAVEDCECSDHSCTGCTDENMHKVSKTVSEDYQSTILKIAGRSGFLFGTCQWILREDLNMADLHEICATVTLQWAEVARIFGCWKHGCGPPLSLFTWFGLWFLCDSGNEVAAMRALFPGHSWYSGTTADHPTCDSKSQFHWYFQQW